MVTAAVGCLENQLEDVVRDVVVARGLLHQVEGLDEFEGVGFLVELFDRVGRHTKVSYKSRFPIRLFVTRVCGGVGVVFVVAAVAVLRRCVRVDWFFWVGRRRGVENRRVICITYKDGTGDHDKDAGVRVAGHGVDGRDFVLYPLEGQTLKWRQKSGLSSESFVLLIFLLGPKLFLRLVALHPCPLPEPPPPPPHRHEDDVKGRGEKEEERGRGARSLPSAC